MSGVTIDELIAKLSELPAEARLTRIHRTMGERIPDKLGADGYEKGRVVGREIYLTISLPDQPYEIPGVKFTDMLPNA
jgi:hypothetical protein